MEKQLIIAIGREVGSGGHEIAELLAKHYDIPLIDKNILESIAEKAMEKDTGARALRAIIEEFMLDIRYEIPKDDNIGRVTITREYIEHTGGPIIEMRGTKMLEENSGK
jgi:ATP-dependent Clp protease ATP-binding subunit ClpX